MREPEMWTLQTSSARSAPRRAHRAEECGWDGFAVTDSQNLAGDAWVALTAAAYSTRSLKLGTSVTNPVTRHPAVTAAAAAGLAVLAGDRISVGIGRGDSALAHIGRAPASVATLEHYVRTVRCYLAGAAIDLDDLERYGALAPPAQTLGLAGGPTSSRLTWRRPDDSSIPVEVAASGPKTIAAAARSADRVVLAVGADATRLRWAIGIAHDACRDVGRDPATLRIGAYLNVVAHPRIATARALARGSLTSVARFSVMHGEPQGPTDAEQRRVLESVHRSYDMNEHTRSGASHAAATTDDFVDGFAIVGRADRCVERLREVAALGVDKVVVIGVSPGSEPDEAAIADREMEQVLADLTTTSESG